MPANPRAERNPNMELHSWTSWQRLKWSSIIGTISLVTDHSALRLLFNQPNLSGHFARWILSLQDYKIHVVVKPGKAQPADALSRVPRREPRFTFPLPDAGPIEWPGDE